VREGRLQPVPKHLRDAHYAGARALGHGVGYRNPAYSPDAEDQMYMSVPKKYYVPPGSDSEAESGKAGESAG